MAFTHGIGATTGPTCEQTCALAPGAATAVARKNVPAFALNVKAPFAATRALPSDRSLPAARPPTMVTVATLPAPPCVTRPARVAPTPLLPALRAVRLTAPGAIDAGEATVPATFTAPTSGVYGVQKLIQEPTGTDPKTPLIASSALYTFAPKVARPGVPTGTSGGGRQIWMYAGPRAACAPEVATR